MRPRLLDDSLSVMPRPQPVDSWHIRADSEYVHLPSRRAGCDIRLGMSGPTRQLGLTDMGADIRSRQEGSWRACSL
jgi:hypothetical protein